MPSSAIRTSSGGRPKRSSRASARGARRPKAAAPRSSRRWSGSRRRPDMRRAALGLGIGLLALLWILGVATVLTTRYGDPMLWPARDARIVEVYVVSNGYHTGIALPRERLAEFASGRGYPALIAVTQRFNQFPWLEIGWGDEEFYRKVPTVGDLSLPVALRALFSPGNKI